VWDRKASFLTSISRKLGDMLLDALMDNDMEVINDGSCTYHKDGCECSRCHCGKIVM